MADKYDLKDLKTPVLQGTPLNLACKLIEPLPSVSSLLVANTGGFLLRQKKYKQLLQTTPPLLNPSLHTTYKHKTPTPPEEVPIDYNSLPTLFQPNTQTRGNAPFYSSRDYYEAYVTKNCTPVSVAKAIIKAIKEDEARDATIGGGRVGAVSIWNEREVLEQAEESQRRLESRSARSVLEGVPFVVKDMVDVKGVPTTCGTAYMGRETPTPREDAYCVRMLREAGMVLVGKSVMHEIGIAPIGVSVPPKNSARNPYNSSFHPGGSSSGSAAAIAYGLCPIALGTDTGGSIRVPAACSGCYGLKATFDAVKMEGVYPFNPSTDHVGPLASTTEDLALALKAMTGADLSGYAGGQEPETILKGKRVGIYRAWFDGGKTAKEREYTAICEGAVKELEEMGAEIVDISMPHMEAMKVAHLISVSHQAGDAMSQFWKKHKGEMLGSTRFTLIAAKAWKDQDFVLSQKMRAVAIESVLKVFESCDVIATPACQVPAPKIKSLSLNDRSDITLVGKLMKYVYIGNLVGLPGIVCPVGYTDKDRLPVALQFYGNFFEEDLLLQVASAVEHGILKDSRRTPQHFVDILGTAAEN